MTDNTDVVSAVPVFKCDECSKAYTIKSSYQSHMRLKHKANKVSEDIENGSNTSKKKTTTAYKMWTENEVDEMPLMMTKELDSYLDNRNDASLMAAAAEIERAIEAEIMVQKFSVKSHELEWYEEDNNSNFSEEFRSNFASSLRESLPSQQVDPVAALHNEMVKTLTEKYDKLVVSTTKMLNIAEITKKDLRKTVKSLNKNLAETRENWQKTVEEDAKEINDLKDVVAAQKIKIKDLESKTKADEPEVVNQKCEKCNNVFRNRKLLKKHMKEAHGVKEGKRCPQCPETLPNNLEFRKHVKDHLMDKEFFCELCKETFRRLEDAQAHAGKPCANIKRKEVVIEMEVIEETNNCNACSTTYTSNARLEQHMESEHNEKEQPVDCSKCQERFKTQEDVYKHANKCTEIIDPLMCDKCNRELISRAGLEKHRKRCQGEQDKSMNRPFNKEVSTEPCANGPDCRFLRQNRCLYNHEEPNDQPWERVQPRRQGRKQNQAKQQHHPRQQHQPRQQQQQFQGQQQLPRQQLPRQQLPLQQLPRQQLPRQQLPRQRLQECRNGRWCIFWKHDRCNFSHLGARQQIRQGVDSRQQHQDSRQHRQDLDSRQSKQGLDSRQNRQGLDSRRQDEDTSQAKPCKFGARCDRILSCGYLHLAKDFLSVQGQRRN